MGRALALGDVDVLTYVSDVRKLVFDDVLELPLGESTAKSARTALFEVLDEVVINHLMTVSVLPSAAEEHRSILANAGNFQASPTVLGGGSRFPTSHFSSCCSCP